MKYKKHIEILEECLIAFEQEDFVGGQYVCNEIQNRHGHSSSLDLCLSIKEYILHEHTMHSFLWEHELKKPLDFKGNQIFPSAKYCYDYRITMLNDLLEYYRGDCEKPLWNSILNRAVGEEV